MKCYLRDRNAELVAAWQKYFAALPDVEASQGDIFDITADAVVSPANSFGFMDGGIDLVYSKRFGWHVQERIQEILCERFDGELPIGLAVAVETDDEQIPICISAPTMRAPTKVADTLNAYLAFRAALRVAKQINTEKPGTITSILSPGMATATGEMEPAICAKQMHAAWVQVVEGQSWIGTDINTIINEHYRLLRDA
jgi:O-acetyl-ADP-ribose deacetylase (regulator of RNase III)